MKHTTTPLAVTAKQLRLLPESRAEDGALHGHILVGAGQAGNAAFNAEDLGNLRARHLRGVEAAKLRVLVAADVLARGRARAHGGLLVLVATQKMALRVAGEGEVEAACNVCANNTLQTETGVGANAVRRRDKLKHVARALCCHARAALRVAGAAKAHVGNAASCADAGIEKLLRGKIFLLEKLRELRAHLRHGVGDGRGWVEGLQRESRAYCFVDCNVNQVVYEKLEESLKFDYISEFRCRI